MFCFKPEYDLSTYHTRLCFFLFFFLEVHFFPALLYCMAFKLAVLAEYVCIAPTSTFLYCVVRSSTIITICVGLMSSIRVIPASTILRHVTWLSTEVTEYVILSFVESPTFLSCMPRSFTMWTVFCHQSVPKICWLLQVVTWPYIQGSLYIDWSASFLLLFRSYLIFVIFYFCFNGVIDSAIKTAEGAFVYSIVFRSLIL